MNLSEERAARIFKAVKEVLEEIRTYCLAADRGDISIEDIQWVIERLYKIKIAKELVSFEAEFLRGLIERYSDRVHIYVRRDMTEPWIRFTSTKELCHIIIDTEEEWSTDGTATLRELLYELSFQNDKEALSVVQSETFAEIVALELLYPHQDRLRDIELVAKGELSLTKIADFYKIPVSLVSRALDRTYNDMIEKIWKLV